MSTLYTNQELDDILGSKYRDFVSTVLNTLTLEQITVLFQKLDKKYEHAWADGSVTGDQRAGIWAKRKTVKLIGRVWSGTSGDVEKDRLGQYLNAAMESERNVPFEADDVLPSDATWEKNWVETIFGKARSGPGSRA